MTKDAGKIKGKDRLTHRILFSDGAKVPLYVGKHPRAEPHNIHKYLRSPDVFVIEEAAAPLPDAL